MKRCLFAAVLAAAPLVALAQSAAPDVILLHGKVFTADPAHRFAEAVAIKGDRITAVGTNAEIEALAGDQTKRFDAGGRVVIPGINDAHTHQSPLPSEQFGLLLDNDLNWQQVSAGLVNATEETPGDRWIFATIGPKVLKDPAVTKQALDKAAGRFKVVLSEFTGHGMILSTSALSALHIRDNAPDPAGGSFERDANGHLTGKAFEYAGYNTDRMLADTVTDDEAIEALKMYADAALHFGITSIQNMSFQSLARCEKVERHGPAPIRIRMIRFPSTDATGRDLHEGGDLPPTHAERPLSMISGTKWILDGTPIEQGAATRRPYPNTEGTGRLNFSPDQLQAIVKEAFDSKEQTLLHVAGDRTAATLFDAMRAVAPAEAWRAKRLRVEHGDGLLPDLIPIAKDLGVVVVQNPTHLVARELYPAGGYMPLKSLLKAGIPLALGSDGAMNPYLNIQLATTNPTNPSEALTREEAVDAYTRGSAFAEFAENDKGTIAPGKLADLAVLSQDIFRVSPDRLPETVSVLTIVGGRIAYASGLLQPKK